LFTKALWKGHKGRFLNGGSGANFFAGSVCNVKKNRFCGYFLFTTDVFLPDGMGTIFYLYRIEI